MFQLPRRRGTVRSNTTNGNNANGNGTGSRNDVSGAGGNSTSATAISSSDYARRCRELMTLDRDLRALGANTLFDLPSITVIGGQSAGKSSLVEAVSGINVPRDSGTCTRCPMECVMSSSAESWSCDISLRFDYDSPGATMPIGTYTFGSTITDKRAVELWLRRAQAAILSPHLSYQDFYTKSVQELKNLPPDSERLPFSKNAVLVSLCDPDITDLSFVDLPGLIQNERPDVIEVVRDLAVSRITSNNTLILVTIPMSDDIQNQQAARLAKDADPAGERTIAVLTKPDILGAGATGSRQKWKDILEGKDQVLTHGYYCVRLPDDDERSRGISRAESERRAAEYFDSTQPWRDILDRNRFGVSNLATFLSGLLVARIESYLPTLRKQLDALLEQYNAELLRLPSPPTSEPVAEVLLRISAFCNAFRAAVFGDDNKSVSQQNRRLYLQFKADIRSTCPDFRPFAGYLNFQNPNIVDLEPPDNGASTTGACVPESPLDLIVLRQVIADSIGWELPNHVPFEATRVTVLKFTKEWRSASVACFDAVVKGATDFLVELMTTHFGQFSQLERYIGTLIGVELKTLEKMLVLEKLPLFTQNTHQFRTETKVWFTRYNTVRHHSEIYRLGVRPPIVALIPRPQVFEGEEYADELTLMANVRAYWQIAYQRIIDYVPLLIEHEFNQHLSSRLQEVLFKDILEGPDTRTKMQELLTEDLAISTRRSFLEGRIARLVEIKQTLDGLS